MMENSSTPEWKLAIVKAIAETIFPAFPEDAELARQAGKEGLARMMETSASSMEFVVTAVVEDMKTLTPEIQRELALLFFLLRTGPGTAVVGGPKMLIPTCPPMQSFARMSLRQREGILQYWATGPIPLLRKALKGLKSLVVNALFNATNTKGQNPLWEGIKYDGPDPERPVNPSKERTDAEAVLQRAILDLTNPPCRSPEGLVELVKGVGKIQGSKIHENVTLEGENVVIHTDVVVVGSGAGGGVTAALLAEAGAQVVVLEKGRFTPAAELSLKEREAGKDMYEMGTLLTTTDAGINILAGSTLGGGTRVNWQASFRTPEHVRQEWAHVHGLKDLISYRYTAALDAVCERVGVTTGILEHSKPNQKLKAGLEKLGVHCGEIPRNCSPAHTCGHCCFGCPTGDKQDMTGTYLSDAAGHGARIFTGVFVDKVLMEKCKDGQRKRQAVGVSALTTSTFGGRQFRLVIRAKYVVSSAGTLHTPALLLRSKITCRGNVGKNLRLHPATAVTGVFGEGYEGEKSAHPEPRVPRHSVTVPMPAVLPNWQGQYEVPQDIQSWKGSIFSIFSKHAANWNGSGYGPLLMTPAAHPGIIAASIPWLGGHDYKRLCTWFPYMGVILVLTRDKGSGRVTIGRDGLPRMHYWPNKHDQQSMMNGVILGLETLAAAGSYMVGAPGANPKREVTRHEPYRDEETEEMLDMPKFQKYLQGVRKEGIKKNAFTMFSAHQMGTSKMGIDPKTSVVDPEGQCWEVSNLYVADASIFPTSTGVNPMITVEAMSYMVAQRLAEKFRPVGPKFCPCCPKDSRMGQHAPHYRDFGPKVDMGPECPRFAELIELEDRDLPVTAAEVPKVLPNLKI